jgi:hypothetical protein
MGGLRHQGNRELLRKPVRAAEAAEVLYRSDQVSYPTCWAAGHILFNRIEPAKKYNVWALALDNNKKAFPVISTEADEVDGQISPGGEWLAYASDESGEFQIYVENFPPTPSDRRRLQVSARGGTNPRWRGDGREIYFHDRGDLMAAVVHTGKTLRVEPPRVLFPLGPTFHPAFAYWPAPDGQRFLFSAAIGEEYPRPSAITLTLNRFARYEQ